MKVMSYKYHLMAAVSAVAMTAALPAAAQTASERKTPTSISKSQAGLGNQSELKSKINDLKEAQKELKSASKSKARNLAKDVRDDLQDLKRNLASAGGAMPGKAKKGLSSAIDDALKAFNKSNTRSRDLVMALDPVIAELQELDRSRRAGMGNETGGNKTFGKLNPNTRRSEKAGNQKVAKTDQQAGADIKVKQKAPKVQVQQPAPRVQVQQPAPKVTIQQARPQIIIKQPKPDVKVIQAKPKVTVEKSGEPKVTVQQEGDPKVKVVQAEGKKNAEAEKNKASNTENTANREADRSKADEPRTAERKPVNPELERLRKMGRTLVGKMIYGAKGDDVGEIENVVMKNGQMTAVLVDVGGFLGLGEKRVAIPLEKLKMEKNRLTTSLTEDEAEDLPAYRD